MEDHSTDEFTEQEVHLRILNSDSDSTFVLEPWGEVYSFPAGHQIEIVAKGPAKGSLDLDVSKGAVTVWGWPGSTAFLFKDGKELGSGAFERTRVPDAFPKSVQPDAVPPTKAKPSHKSTK